MDDPDEGVEVGEDEGVDFSFVVRFTDVQGGVDGTKLIEEVSDELEGGIGCSGVLFPSPVLLMSLGSENGSDGSNDLGDIAFGLNGIIPCFPKTCYAIFSFVSLFPGLR